MLAAAPAPPVVDGGDAAAQELVEQVADETIFAEARARVVVALFLELVLDVLKLAAAGGEGLEARLLLARIFLFVGDAAGALAGDAGAAPGAGSGP